MKTSIAAAAAITLFAIQAVHAQGAVQWRVEDGGNGHWYAVTSPQVRSWEQWRSDATGVGCHLATMTSVEENLFVFRLVWVMLPFDSQACVGGYQDRSAASYSEPGGGWRWVTDEPFTWTSWASPNSPSNSPNGPCVCEDYMSIGNWGPGFAVWNDISDGVSSIPAVIEWSADCNNDGIVDYGQILDGTFPDSNSNGIPDCCEGGGSCCVGDILADRVINGADLGALLAYWGPVTASPISRACDLNGDNVVNGADIGLLLAGWGNCP